MALAVKAQPFWVSTMRIAVSGTAGFEETVLADGVMDGVLVLPCGELVGTTGAWDDDMEPVVLHAPSSSARARMSNRGSHATCVGFLHILLSPFVFFSTYSCLLYTSCVSWPGFVGRTVLCQDTNGCMKD